MSDMKDIDLKARGENIIQDVNREAKESMPGLIEKGRELLAGDDEKAKVWENFVIKDTNNNLRS